MAEQEKDNIAPEDPVRSEPAAPPVDQAAAPEDEQQEPPGNAVAEKRGRMVAAALTVAVLLSLIAVGVAAVFQKTGRWFMTCPTDLPVNDPAPVLWEKIESTALAQQSLGVPEKLLEGTRFKAAPVAAAEPRAEAEGKH